MIETETIEDCVASACKFDYNFDLIIIIIGLLSVSSCITCIVLFSIHMRIDDFVKFVRTRFPVALTVASEETKKKKKCEEYMYYI